MVETVKAADRDMTRRPCKECKHWHGRCTRTDYGPPPDEWRWNAEIGWFQCGPELVKEWNCGCDNADGHCKSFEERPKPEPEAKPEPTPTAAERLVELLAEVVSERLESGRK